MDLSTNFDLDDEVVSFLKAIEGVNLCKYLKRKNRRGRKEYENVMLLKIILFARMKGIDTLEGYEDACRYDMRFMYLAQEEKPSFMVFGKLLNNYLIDDIDSVFFEISKNIVLKIAFNRNITESSNKRTIDNLYESKGVFI